jgi:acyl carrier protein
MIVVSMESASGQSIDPLQLLPLKTVADLAKLLQALEAQA